MAFHVCGPFGYTLNQLDGATIKTRLFSERLRSIANCDVTESDTQDWRAAPFFMLNKILRGFIRSNYVIMLTGSRGLQFLLPIFLMLKHVTNTKIVYVVLGGWLPTLLSKNIFLSFLCRNVDGIYVETVEMKRLLSNNKFSNVRILSNFRYFDLSKRYARFSDYGSILKILYYSRVTHEKGVELAIESVKKFNYGGKRATLDIYGPIDYKYEGKFYSLLDKAGLDISYRGILNPDASSLYNTISDYDLTLFPTFYSGEGFPGTIIDSLISGVPIIASDWKYNKEIIIEGETGFVFDLNDAGKIVDIINKLYIDRDKLNYMKNRCIQESAKYHSDELLKEFLNNIKLDQYRKTS